MTYRPRDGVWSERAIVATWERFGPIEARLPVWAKNPYEDWAPHRYCGTRMGRLPTADMQARRMR